MRIEQIEAALRDGIPFEIATAGGDKFQVTSREKVVHVIPFLTMTSQVIVGNEDNRAALIGNNDLTYLRPKQP